MIDRELLELAAKMAGAEINGYRGSEPLYATEKEVESGEFEYAPWNPLEDDGDALRLAVKLEISVLPGMEISSARHPGFTIWMNESNSGDPAIATRRAIVRVAAEMGRAAS